MRKKNAESLHSASNNVSKIHTTLGYVPEDDCLPARTKDFISRRLFSSNFYHKN